MGHETYEVLALRYAERPERLRQENFLEPVDAHDAPMPIDYFVWVIRNANRTVVVDTGFDHAEAARRGRRVMRLPSQALASIGVDAAGVEDVVITHLHYDHAGTLGDFPRARFHVQESEMQFVTGRWMLDDGERHAYSAEHVAELVHRLFEKRVAFHHEDGEIAPGVTVHRMPGHTMGMQSVRVPTRRGWVLLASRRLALLRALGAARPVRDLLVAGRPPGELPQVRVPRRQRGSRGAGPRFRWCDPSIRRPGARPAAMSSASTRRR